ncbi:MAG: hypothetical protein JO358_04885 [Alphaproteobacteria bacterium]|nr:hypothetical protein [Alphaproteobacteria bacterium]
MTSAISGSVRSHERLLSTFDKSQSNSFACQRRRLPAPRVALRWSIGRHQSPRSRWQLHGRVGIASGLVVVGGEFVAHDVAGETPTVAARLQAFAEPDTVVVAASTRRLTGELFEIPEARRDRTKGHRRAGFGLAGAAPERHRQPVRGVARIDAEPAGRPRRRNRPAVAPLGAPRPAMARSYWSRENPASENRALPWP